MKQSFTKNYLKIYFWQTLAIVTNLLSMFIVVPALTSNPSVYGMYTLCVSLSLFLSYADLGFVSAGYKYASEAFSRGQRSDEVRIEGFVTFVLGIFVVLYMIAVAGVSLDPGLIVRGLNDPDQKHTASLLLLILAFSAPNTMMQRFLNIVYGVRLEDYVFQRINIAGNIVKIASIYYFFHDARYNIVGYYLFSQTVNYTASVCSMALARKRYAYDMREFIRSIRYSSSTYALVRNLAFGSLYVTVMWILFYEMDALAISKFLGVSSLALYAVGITVMSFFRNIFGVFYGPFTARFNHFVGVGDTANLRTLYENVLVILMPVVVLPLLCLILLAKPFIVSWVGPQYAASVVITILLAGSYLGAFISYPAGILLAAQERIREMNLVATMIVIIFWAGITLSVKTYGIVSFALFKLIAFSVMYIFYGAVSLKFLDYSLGTFLRRIIAPLVPSVVMMSAVLIPLARALPLEKSKAGLAWVIGCSAMITLAGLLLYYGMSPRFRKYINDMVSKIIARLFRRSPAVVTAT